MRSTHVWMLDAFKDAEFHIANFDFGGEESRIIFRTPLCIPFDFTLMGRTCLSRWLPSNAHSNTILIRNGKTCGIRYVRHTTAIDSSTTSISYIQLIIREFSLLFLCRSLLWATDVLWRSERTYVNRRCPSQRAEFLLSHIYIDFY